MIVGMYKIEKDLERSGRYKMSYYPFTEIHEHLYEMENLEWEFVHNHVRDVVPDEIEITWMHDVIRLLDKSVNLSDSGSWYAN